MGEIRAQGKQAADHMGSSDARRFLSRLSGALGVGGVLLVLKPDSDAEGADLAPGSALRWPKCECGSPKCPDYEPPAEPLAEPLSARVAEANRRSRRGGL